MSRLELLFTELFDPSVATAWVSYAAFLILRLCAASESYNRPLHDHPLLKDAKFSSTAMAAAAASSGTSAAGSSASQPMFSMERMTAGATLATQTGALGSQATGPSQLAAGFLRATQARSWTATQHGGGATQSAGGGGFGGGGSAAPAASPFLGSGSMPPPPPRRGLGASRDSQRRRRFGDDTGEGEGEGDDDDDREEGSSGAGSSSSKRSFKSAGPSQRYGIDNRHAAARARQTKARAGKVQIFRAYRTGELPDVQVRGRYYYY